MTDLITLKAQMRICADCAIASPNGKTYLNEAARPMLRQAADAIERLQDALKPFADAAARFTPYVGQMEEKEVNAFFTLGQLRAAAAALSTSNRVEGER